MSYQRYKQDPKDLEKLRLTFARVCWPKRNELCPSGRVTWSRRFEEMFGITLREFAIKMEKEKNERQAKAAGEGGKGTQEKTKKGA